MNLESGPRFPKFAPKPKHNVQSLKLILNQCCYFKVSSNTEPQEVIKLKREVLRQLLPALDDHKRLVRREAVAARNAWALASS